MIIGHVYRTLGGGGIPRGAESLFTMLHAMGHQIVVFTYELSGDEDFKINVPYKRIIIGNVDVKEASSAERTARLKAAVIEARCDLIIHNVYYARSTIDDLRLFKEMGVPTLVQWHSCFSELIMTKVWEGHVLEQIEGVAKLARGVITLTQMDKAFFELMGVPAVHIPYSDPDIFEKVPVHGDGHRLIWVGRMVTNKRPLHAVKILERVLVRFPDTTLTMLGDGSRRKEVERYLAARPVLSEHVSMCGFISDVRPYLQDADIFLVTSAVEGFMHSLVEAKMAALPTVGYRMDYLDTTRPGTGYCAVPQGDVDAAAEEVCRLLANPEERHILGLAARKDFEWFLHLDLRALYMEAFDIALHPQNHLLSAPPAFVPDILRILLEHVDSHGLNRKREFEAMNAKKRLYKGRLRMRKEEMSRLRKKTKLQRDKMRKLKLSRAYRIGQFVIRPVRKLKKLFSRFSSR